MTAAFIFKVSFAGFFATYLHILLGLWAPQVGLPQLDFAKRMASLAFDKAYDGNPPYVLGLAVVFLNGIFFTLLYAALIGPLLPGTPLVRSLIFTGALYLVAQCFFVPVFMRGGIFGLKSKEPIYLTMIIVYGEFGLVLGWLSPVLGVAD